MRRIPPDLRAGVVAGIKAGKTAQIIRAETGLALETIRYIAAREGLTLTSRYVRVIPGSYWRRRCAVIRRTR